MPLEPASGVFDWRVDRADLTNGERSPWEPLFLCYLKTAPGQLADGAPHHLRQRFASARAAGRYQWHYVEHHMAHEASAFLAAPFDECAVMTLDGRGELNQLEWFFDNRFLRKRIVVARQIVISAHE